MFTLLFCAIRIQAKYLSRVIVGVRLSEGIQSVPWARIDLLFTWNMNVFPRWIDEGPLDDFDFLDTELGLFLIYEHIVLPKDTGCSSVDWMLSMRMWPQ